MITRPCNSVYEIDGHSRLGLFADALPQSPGNVRRLATHAMNRVEGEIRWDSSLRTMRWAVSFRLVFMQCCARLGGGKCLKHRLFCTVRASIERRAVHTIETDGVHCTFKHERCHGAYDTVRYCAYDIGERFWSRAVNCIHIHTRQRYRAFTHANTNNW